MHAARPGEGASCTSPHRFVDHRSTAAEPRSEIGSSARRPRPPRLPAPAPGKRAPGRPAGAPIREEVIGSGPPPAASRPRPSSSCPAAIRCAVAFSASSSASSCADPRCSISRDPRREDHTTCTAVAPDVVFTVLMYGTRPLYGPRLVRKFRFNEPKTSRSTTRDPAAIKSWPNSGHSLLGPAAGPAFGVSADPGGSR